MADGHYPFAHAPHYSAMTSSLGGSRDMTSERGVVIGDGSGGGFPMHGYSHRGTGMSSSSCAMVPACVLPPSAGVAPAAVHTGNSLTVCQSKTALQLDVVESIRSICQSKYRKSVNK